MAKVKNKDPSSLGDFQLDSLSELQDISDSYEDIAKMQTLTLDSLITEKQDRTYLDMESIERLSRSILTVGEVLNPLIVEQKDGGKFLVYAGHRRLEACKILVREGHEKFSRVMCKVKSNNLSMAMLIDNLARDDLNAIETAFALKKRLDDPDYEFETQRDLALAIGKHETWVSRYLKLLNLPEEILEVGVLGIVQDPNRLNKLAKLLLYKDACEALKKGMKFKDVIQDFANEVEDREPEPVFKLKGNNLHFLCKTLSQIEGLDFSYIKDEPVKSLTDFLVHVSKMQEEKNED